MGDVGAPVIEYVPNQQRMAYRTGEPAAVDSVDPPSASVSPPPPPPPPSASVSPAPPTREECLNKEPELIIPPGKTIDMSEWKKEDALRWVACFLPPHLFPDVFISLKRFDFIGDVLHSIVLRRPSPETFLLPEQEYDLIIRYAEVVLNAPE